ncbi:hypothetical protein ACJMK2_043205 [Sinanodonta woodiana]|uniref:DZIP3-like HEPN domain-containing protein n=1 Tax=Sinanodonta woodiana TaxID=1069815 RepID=A0ABD3VXK2_SINWO
MESTISSKYASTPTREGRNFVKITRLFVDLLRDVLWETLTKRILPEDLPDKVRINKQKLEEHGGMRENQFRRIRRPGGGVVSNVDWWGCETYPDKKHLHEGDDIERIRLGRNKFFGHAGQTILSKDELDQIWADMLALVKRFDIRLKTTFESEMEVILKDKISSDLAEDYMKDFENQNQYDSCTGEIAMEAKRDVPKSRHWWKRA